MLNARTDGPGSERDQARFYSKVALPNEQGCMLWLAYIDLDGYGRFNRGGKNGKIDRAHRIAYELAYGAIPEGMVLDHLCRECHRQRGRKVRQAC